MTDEDYMREALTLAANARGRTSPNPLVGAVVVKNDRIVGAGWHRKAGTPHAEVHALRMAGDLAKGATLYVSLEPCSHQGRTGPCAVAVRDAGIRRVVIAMQDSNPKVAGQGISLLREAGIEVVCGVMEAEARALNAFYLTWMEKGRPYILLKTAMTLDGKIQTATGESRWITGEPARQRVHAWRDVYDSILVGIGTVLADDPSLTTRLPAGAGRNPLRVILDSGARTPLTAKAVTDGAAPTLIVVSEAAPAERIEALKAAGSEVIVCGKTRVDIARLLQELAKRDIVSVLLEGGATVNFAFLEAGLVDAVAAFIAPKLVGGETALTPVGGRGIGSLADAVALTDVTMEAVGEDVLLCGRVRR
ncbi:bifunctional diaminohydroxyphosphoribosylaminopyrimidine deaminase/5-amino-6-(5-phosphoribosylamino)uracil reductase RibD [Selenomonas sp. TAMA-11512]|uniref:bifunctional diaminohydroxyphosphoribosylaminopyrimidine deaminase/5-amino-6-(5-phosphoribosylamino)uracil reductase RibD n=1 Tax=Selenomonas sp. TAMA-11512 TaxID=3095337 RepID=UPI00308F4166|nr:bifunctional diaminohydroxyphosphoribosylaminopyrimidine deaminase/5-amino-6-(5-phosphoribosylamino)uracil reductase RibD [Selenomonas sp. TAMA-11512]